MRFDVHIAKPPMLISDSLGHGSRRTYASVHKPHQPGGVFRCRIWAHYVENDDKKKGLMWCGN
jgi:hypothetical protein